MHSDEITTTPEGGAAARPSGPVAAAFVAAGVGSLVLGILTVLAEASEAAKGWLEFSASVGPLSGETILAVAAWLVAWAVLHAALRHRDVSPPGRLHVRRGAGRAGDPAHVPADLPGLRAGCV